MAVVAVRLLSAADPREYGVGGLEPLGRIGYTDPTGEKLPGFREKKGKTGC